MKTKTLYRPINQAELKLIEDLNWKAFPPRLVGQPIFYPVLNEVYATQITKEWNVPSYGIGYVVKFEVDAKHFETYAIQTVGLEIHQEIWVPASELEVFNSHIIGEIELIGTYE